MICRCDSDGEEDARKRQDDENQRGDVVRHGFALAMNLPSGIRAKNCLLHRAQVRVQVRELADRHHVAEVAHRRQHACQVLPHLLRRIETECM